MANKSKTVSFRVDSELARKLDTAREPFGLSRGEWVRWLLVDRLERNETTDYAQQFELLRERVEELVSANAELRAEMASEKQVLKRISYSLLTMAAHLSHEDAIAVLQKTFTD